MSWQQKETLDVLNKVLDIVTKMAGSGGYAATNMMLDGLCLPVTSIEEVEAAEAILQDQSNFNGLVICFYFINTCKCLFIKQMNLHI
ncbi:hypothetical protein DPMN_135254 [Dreissena polymorpha]|uniref:Uncharacterized protein n=1 Tax=Dreissena polymorpha TaxID=45954 RepID=A0A9D4G0L1_DREPO|nr:hypothetical protein DPMN_135254 [Dreissena polymorpha]